MQNNPVILKGEPPPLPSPTPVQNTTFKTCCIFPLRENVLLQTPVEYTQVKWATRAFLKFILFFVSPPLPPSPHPVTHPNPQPTNPVTVTGLWRVTDTLLPLKIKIKK